MIESDPAQDAMDDERDEANQDAYAQNSTTWFDYEVQAWVERGVYVRCGHPDSMDCACYGRVHEGERA